MFTPPFLRLSLVLNDAYIRLREVSAKNRRADEIPALRETQRSRDKRGVRAVSSESCDKCVFRPLSAYISCCDNSHNKALPQNRIGSKTNQEVTEKDSLVLETLTVWKFVVLVFGLLVTLCGNSITAFSLNSCLGLHNVACSVDHST